MKSKSETFAKFREFKAMAETQRRARIIKLISGLIADEFEEYLKMNGILDFSDYLEQSCGKSHPNII